MPTVHGSLKSNSLVLQAHGVINKDVMMYVHNDQFTMKMGNEILMTVSADSVVGDLDSVDNDATRVIFNKPVSFKEEVNIEKKYECFR